MVIIPRALSIYGYANGMQAVSLVDDSSTLNIGKCHDNTKRCIHCLLHPRPESKLCM